jgi:hypothetical protein
MEKIGEMYGVSRWTIGNQFKKYNLPIKSPTLYNRKYNLNENFFNVIDTEEKAYWLGFLYADGNISGDRNVVALSLAKKDEDHLLKFRHDISAENPIHYKDVKSKNTGEILSAVTLSLCSGKLREDLIKNGCMPNKTFILKYPNYEIVPQNLQRHFIRGMFDGDGCITYSIDSYDRPKISFQILGTLDIVTGILNEIMNSGVIKNNPKIVKAGNIYKLLILGKYNAMQIMNYLYFNSNTFLQRKYDKFLDISNINCNGDYARSWIEDKICSVCGDRNSVRYIRWHKEDEYQDKILCNKHYEQLTKIGKIVDKSPYSKPQIYCINNGMIFDNKKDAVKWCGLKSSHGITKCIKGEFLTSGKDPNTGELLRWMEYDENNQDELKNEKLNEYKNQYKRIRERPIYQIDIKTNKIINIFTSSTEAGKALHKKNFSNITSVCRGRRSSAFGYKWVYVDQYNS